MATNSQYKKSIVAGIDRIAEQSQSNTHLLQMVDYIVYLMAESFDWEDWDTSFGVKDEHK